ncbi:MAG: putative short-subunit dehydrogenase-like oxidoreductase (DUF2520 family) [Maribacter sp.]|jgi:predicted short-subunit dehydrogenase-like oxidoreductase (DUF2520 family)
MKITIIGSGNVGYHLSQRLKEVGHTISQIFSRKTTKVLRISRIIGAIPIDNLSSLQADADLYIIAVKDDVIGLVAEKMRKKLPENTWVVHTSGSVPSTVLCPYFNNYGIFYPLQTFSISRMADFLNIPILIDSNTELMKDRLHQLAETVSPKVYHINDEQRAKLHVTAVMVNNFTNHLYAIAEDILQKEELPMEVLIPLIQETSNKVSLFPAKDMQTGPARRGDEDTIQRHLDFMGNHEEYKEIYEVLTASLKRMYEKKND